MLKEVGIQFGIMFKVSDEYINKKHTNVITDPGEDNWFQTGVLHIDDEGLKMLAPE